MYWDVAVNVTFTGIAIVFAMLVLLVLILMGFGAVMKAVSNSAEKKAEKRNKAALAKMAADTYDISDSAPVAVESAADELEIVAAISAAIATMYSGSGKKPIIKSIKKSGSRRSAWASAGIADNTRAF